MFRAPISVDLPTNDYDRGNEHGPPVIRDLSSHLTEKVTIWQAATAALLWLYACRNFATIVGLDCPEPLANLYAPPFFRATWITTALDAGFWTAMKIKPQWLRDIASLVFSVYYLFAVEQAGEKVRRVRAISTVEHLRVSWNKATTPYLSIVARVRRPRFTRYGPRAIQIARPDQSGYKDPINAWLYFDGPESALREQTCVVLDFPGGGFVALSPRDHEDRLLAWAGKLKAPVMSLDYKKAPEYPYPYALNEGYDVYRHIVATNGRCIGLSGNTRPRIVLTGDSAGANLAVGVTLMSIARHAVPRPDGLFLAYPCLNMKVESWMTEEQISYIRDRDVRPAGGFLQREKLGFCTLTPSSPSLSMEDDDTSSESSRSDLASEETVQTDCDMFSQKSTAPSKQQHTQTAVSSVLSYVHDRILTPELMRALILLYIGPHNRPNFDIDYLLSPVLAPDSLLAQFPKTYFLTGERDPLVDDTVLFAGRLRQIKLRQFRKQQELDCLDCEDCEQQQIFNEKNHVEVSLLPGISHGFFQMVSFFPEGWEFVYRSAGWIRELLGMGTPSMDSVCQAGSSWGSLGSEEDMLGRRMNELTGVLYR